MIKNISFEPGFIVVETDQAGSPRKYSAKRFLQAVDIPAGLTHVQVASIKALANLVVILIRTLIDRQVLDESFMENDDMSLDGIIEAVEAMGGSYHEPTLEDADA